jgi:hypothetical protein
MQSNSSGYVQAVLLAACFLLQTPCATAQPQARTAPPELHAGIKIVIDLAEDVAIKAAARDLSRDLAKVLGAPSPVVSSAADTDPAIVITCKATSTAAFRDRDLTVDESYSLRLASIHPLRIVLQGGDVRGTIYSIYKFSDRALGVPPLWFWSGWQPQPKPQIEVGQQVFRRVQAPSVRWRGWFPNDTDMLEPWLNSSPDHIDLFLETLLRLRYNVLDVDHVSNWNGRPNLGLLLARACRSRGIRVTFTHLAPFGFLLGDWNQYWTTVRHTTPPPKLLSNVPALDEYWTYAIHFVQDEHLDPIQSIEFRVDGDKPFWRDFPDAPTDPAKRAEVITFMLRHQFALLHKVTGGEPPLTRTVFYNEVGEFLNDGELAPPVDPRLIWNFASEQRDHFPRPEIFEPHQPQHDFGYYFNFQFFTTGSHVVSGEGPWKTEQNIRMVSNAVGPGQLRLVMLNVGNLREFLMEVSVASELLWDRDTTADQAVTSFCARYFGIQHALAALGIYKIYYDAYWQQRQPDLRNFDRQYIFHDLRYARASENLLARVETRRYTPDPLFADSHMLRIVPGAAGAADEPHAIAIGTLASAARFEAATHDAERLRAELPPEEGRFFQEAIEADAQFMRSANRFLYEIAQAYIAVENPNEAREHLDGAAQYLAEMQATSESRERPYLPNWYEHETKFNLQGIARRLEHARSSLLQYAVSGQSPSAQ